MEDNDVYPRVPTGRLCSNSTEELAAICDVILSYPGDSSKQWRRTVVFSGWAPWACRHHDIDDSTWRCLEEIGSCFDVKFEFENYLNASELGKTVWSSRLNQFSLKQAIEEGALIVRYFGHGLGDRWSNVGTSNAFRNDEFTNDDVRELKLGRWAEGVEERQNSKLPLVLSCNLSTGILIEPQMPTRLLKCGRRNSRLLVSSRLMPSVALTGTSAFPKRSFSQLVSHQKRHRIGDLLVDARPQLLSRVRHSRRFFQAHL